MSSTPLATTMVGVIVTGDGLDSGPAKRWVIVKDLPDGMVVVGSERLEGAARGSGFRVWRQDGESKVVRASDLFRYTPSERFTSMQIVNLTPHPITYQPHIGGPTTTWDSAGVARVVMNEEVIAHLPVAIYARTPKEVIGLPGPTDGVLCIVSDRVRAACPDRLDLISPGSGTWSIVRDDNGQIVACRDFDG